MFVKTRSIVLIAAAFTGAALLSGSAFAQSASLFGGGPYNVGVGAGGGGGSGMDPAGGGPGPSGGTVFGRWHDGVGALGARAEYVGPAESRRVHRHR